MSEQAKGNKKIEHLLSEAWREHTAEVLAQIRALEGQIILAKAQILDASREREFMIKHLSVLIDRIARAEHLPDINYKLSPDGTKLLGEEEEEPGG